jgi:hypothetical protein
MRPKMLPGAEGTEVTVIAIDRGIAVHRAASYPDRESASTINGVVVVST